MAYGLGHSNFGKEILSNFYLMLVNHVKNNQYLFDLQKSILPGQNSVKNR